MQEWPPTTPPPEPEEETETNPEENQEVLSVSEIMEKIERGEEPSREEEKILKENIEDAILRRGSEETTPEELSPEEEEKREEEKKMLEAYLKGVEMGWFKEGDVTKVAIDFDLETIEFNRFNDEEKREKINNKKEKFKDDLASRDIMVDDFEEMREEKEKMEKKLIEQSLDYEDILARIQNEKLDFDELGRARLKEIISSLKENNRDLLDLHKFEYYFEGIDDLAKEYHIEKIYIIKMLEEAMAAYDQIIILLEKKEEELTEEEKGMLEKIFQFIKENPKLTLLAVLALLAALGLVTCGIPTIPGVPSISMPGMPNMPSVAGAVGVIGGLGLLGGILYKLSQIKEENVDDFMSKICGVSISHRKKTTEKKA